MTSQPCTPARRRTGPVAAAFGVLVIGGCASRALPACVPQPVPDDDVVYLVEHGWHTDLAIPAHSMRGRLTLFRRIFPGMTVLLAGFGRRSFMMAPVTDIGDLLIGPFPGAGTVRIAGLTAPPDRAYGDGTMTVLQLPPGGAERLSGFIWRTLQTDHGQPVRIGAGFFPGSVFYAARTGYSGLYTCNSWTEDALHAAGLTVGPAGVLFASQVMKQALHAAGNACSIGGGS